MSTGQSSEATLLWVKELSTSIFLKMRRNAFENEFIQRNKKQLIICFLIWISITITASIIFQTQVYELKDDFYQKRLAATQGLSERMSTAVLEKDLLTLNITLGETKTMGDLIFAAVVDHKNKVMAHSDPQAVNQSLKLLKKGKQITAVGKISIQEEFLPTGKKIVNFSSHINFNKISIGKLYLAFSSSQLENSLKRNQAFLISSIVVSFFLLSFVIVARNRSSLSRAKKVQKSIDDGIQIGSYKLREKIAEGGMAEVFIADYLAEDSFRKTVAIKRILPHIAKNREFRKMFIQEARMAALLQHPHIVQIYDFGKLNEDYFIAMEYIRGKNLAHIMARLQKAMEIDQAVFIISRISMGLHYSHFKKDDQTGELLHIVHRDISPQNILISFQGEVKITDFGICKAENDPNTTSAGVIKGKVCYLSPEQALGQTVDNQTDIYALGIVSYEMLSGKRLYKFSSEIEAIRSIPEKEVAPLKDLRPDIPDALNAIIMKCLEIDKKKRYQSAQEFNNNLIRLKQRLSITYDASDLASFMEKHFKEEQRL